MIPLFRAQTPADEALAAQCAALAMMRGGTTTFLEAGTFSHLDATMEALAATGIRGRVGEWVEGRAYDPTADQAKVSAAAIAQLEREIARWPDKGETRLAAWPILVGHSTNSDDIWRAATRSRRPAWSARLRPHESARRRIRNGSWRNTAVGPLQHLADIGVLGGISASTHLADIDRAEPRIADCVKRQRHPLPACRPHRRLWPLADRPLSGKWIAAGVNVMMGTDGVEADVLGSARLTASLFRDARRDQNLMDPGAILELATVNGALGLGMSEEIGSLEPGKKADFVLHDTDIPEWGPVFDPVAQLALDARTGAVHGAWIDGVQVVDAGRATLINEAKVLSDARQAGAALIARTGLPTLTQWSVL